MKYVLLVALVFLLTSCAETVYRSAMVYCPNAPPLKIDSVSHVFRERSSILIMHKSQRYVKEESPSCTVRYVN